MRPANSPRIVTVMAAPRVRRVDVAAAAALTVVLVIAMVAVDRNAATDARPLDALAFALIVVAGSVLAFHRRAPMLVLGVTTAVLALYGLRDYVGGPVYLTWIAAIFAVSLARGPGRSWAPVVVSAVVVLVPAVAIGGHVVGQRLVEGRDSRGVVSVLVGSWALGALLLGGSVRGRRAERAALQEEALRRVAEERLRIARDLHDSVAHSMASISVQAGVGAHVLDERPEDARAALLAIKDASGDTLAELRSTLGMLRSGEAAPREPAAGLDRLASLVESSRAAGLDVDVVVEGEARPLPPAVDTAAFRIVQESLTNVIRHAGTARATVAVRHGAADIELEVTDDGRGAAGAGGVNGTGGTGGGHGLAGMRERVALLGGELVAGNVPSGGYRVRARFPL